MYVGVLPFQVLSENKVGTEGGRAICEMLVNNRNLYKVDLRSNDIGDGAVPSICEVLYVRVITWTYNFRRFLTKLTFCI